MFAMFCILYWPNTLPWISEAEKRAADGHSLAVEVERGIPIRRLSSEYGAKWMFTPDHFAANMRMLAKARIGIYRDSTPPAHTADLLAELADGIELKGPSTSGRLFQMRDFNLPGTLGVIAHAAHRCSIGIPSSARTVKAGFGILPNNQTEGVEFRVSIRERNGNSVLLWSRRLDPAHSAADGGLQHATMQVPTSSAEGGRLVFETLPLGDPAGAWAYWTDITVN
jgi:hypothetical protein